MRCRFSGCRILAHAVILPALLFLLTLGARAADRDDAPTESDIKPVDLEKLFAGGDPESIQELRAMQGHVEKLAEKVMPATVGVIVGQAQGSGVIVSKDGYVMTAAHVNGAPNKDVTFIFQDGKTAKGKTLGVHRGVDAGLMKITDKGDWPYLEIGDSTKLQQGQWVLATGHPGGYQRGRRPVVRLGRVLTSRSNVIMTDCTLVGGDSGGPLFDMDGNVVGIHSRIGGTLTSNMHVPAQPYQDEWDRFVAAESWGGRTGGPYIGIQADREAENARIASVYPDTPAAKAGLEAGDVILKFDGKAIKDFPSLSQQVGRQKPGDRVKVEVQRGEDKITLEIVVGERGK